MELKLTILSFEHKIKQLSNNGVSNYKVIMIKAINTTDTTDHLKLTGLPISFPKVKVRTLQSENSLSEKTGQTSKACNIHS